MATSRSFGTLWSGVGWMYTFWNSVQTRIILTTKRHPFTMHAILGSVDVVRALMTKGASINALESSGRSPLHQTITNNHSNVALLLLRQGADPDSPDHNKATPLHYACHYGYMDVVRMLIAEGASRDVVDALRCGVPARRRCGSPWSYFLKVIRYEHLVRIVSRRT